MIITVTVAINFLHIHNNVHYQLNSLFTIKLGMQESADNVSPDSTSPSKDALLEEACKKYDEATHLCPTLHDVQMLVYFLDNGIYCHML